MPIYEYQCESCGQRSEAIQRLSDPPLTTCDKCAGPLKKLISAPAFQFKGSGWYVTDYADKSKSGKEGKDGKESKGDKESKGGKEDKASKGDGSKSESGSSSSSGSSGSSSDSGSKSDSSKS